jgi:hypothetical protein
VNWPRRLLFLTILGATLPARADDPPVVEHQPTPCTIPEKPISLCATVTDDAQVARSRLYFRAAGEDFYSFVDMVFSGINYCGTLPAPREGKVKAIEYYVQAVDDQYQSRRTSTYQMIVQPEGVCEFPPLEKEEAKAASIVVHATNKKQGKKLPDGFAAEGVSFVPIAAK